MIRRRVSRIGKRQRGLLLESLERRDLLAATPVISEFMAVNVSTLEDEDGDYSDWIELFNPGSEPVNLNGYWLTDRASDLTGWRVPDITIDPGGYRVIFASSKDRDDPDGELHTDFKLNSDGEYLALVGPDGTSVIHEYAPQYPPQVADVAYGVAPDVQSTNLVAPNVTARYHVPQSNLLQSQWALNDFNDATWSAGPTGIGYDTGEEESDPMVESILALNPLGYWRFEETSNTPAINEGSLGASLNGTYRNLSPLSFTEPGPGLNDPLYGFGDGNVATKFDGQDDYVTTSQPVLNYSAQFTMVGMIKPGQQTTGRVGLFGQNDVVEFGFITPTTLQVWTPTGGSLNYNYNLPLNEWHHLAVVGNGTDLRLYVDGGLALTGGSPTGSYGSSTSPFNIGGGGIFDTSGNYFTGVIDEVAIFDKALTYQQIISLVGEGEPGGDGDGDFTDFIETNVQSEMYEKSSSLWVRIPFEVPDPSRFNQLLLGMQYDDGFVAYINGVEATRRNALGEEDEPLSFDAAASGRQADRNAVVPEVIDISDSRDALQPGTNILGIHLLNVSADNPDLLLLPTLDGSVVVVNPNKAGYLTTPTPGKSNHPISEDLGPLVTDVLHTPHEPTQDQPIVVTASVAPTLQEVSRVELVYRVMYNAENTILMVDNGTGDDAIAGDGIYTATIPGGIATSGDMIRWYVRASDTGGAAGELPKYEVFEPNEESPRYFGALVADPSIDAELPVLYWWVENETAADNLNRTGTRAQLYFNGEFYDNMFVRPRGGSTADNPLHKRHYKFDFDQERFRFDPAYKRVEEFNLNTTASDKAYVRQSLAFEAYSMVGSPSSVSFPLHVIRNNQFYGVFEFIEEPDDEMLEREGLDDNGALYKIYNEFTSASGARKKTRTDEGSSDLVSFIDAIRVLEGDELRAYLFDNVNLPATLNYLVATVLVHQNDNPHKNHFLYRDTEGTGEWLFIPWDHDLTWGSNWVGTSFSDVIYANVDEITFGPKPSWDLSLIQPSHPLVNTEQHREWNNHWNRLMDALLNDPIIRQMYLRRLRTAMDELLGPPGTTDSVFDQRWDYYLENMAGDAALDKLRWANPRWPWGEDQTFAQAVEIVKTQYLEVRRQHLYVTHSIDNLDPGDIVTVVPEFTTARYFVPSNDLLGTSWTNRTFDDSSWPLGQTGIGFENSPGSFQDLIKTQVKPTDTVADGTSIFVRIPFQVDDPSQVKNLTLRMKYDDGFVAYLNGTEVARGNLRDDGAQYYNSRALPHGNTQALEFENILISQHLDKIQPGQNVLAIHALNSSVTSSDMFVLPELVDGVITSVEIAGIPHAQEAHPPLRFDPNDFDATPESGNQDEEYIKLDNPTDVAVDVSGWRLDGGIRHTFRPGTIIPAGMSLYVSPNVPAFRARATGPSGGQSRLVQGNYEGHLSGRGETIELIAPDGTLIDTLVTPDESTDAQRFLRVTELHYNPRALDEATEFIELQNISSGAQAMTLDLSGVTVSEGPREPFIIPDGVQLPAGQFVVIVRDTQAFRAAYPNVDSSRILGEFDGNLSNQGERIKVDDAQGNTIVDFDFGTNDPWPESADGVGASLVLIDPVGTPPDQMDKYYRWRGSTEAGGSPAAASAPVIGVVINEVLSHPDPVIQTFDAIELMNVSSQTISLGGWYVSDSGTNPHKYQIPAGTQLAAGQYLVIDEADFNPAPGHPGPNDFELNGTAGDDVWLTILDAGGQIVSFVDDVHFGGAIEGESFGRFPNAEGRLAPMSRVTFGADNAYPRVGPLIISEVQYNPGPPSAAAKAANRDVTEDDLEFIEIYNPTNETVSFANWQIQGGIDYDFDSNVQLGAGQTLLVLPFNPDSPANHYRLAAFRAHYGIDDSVVLLGGYGGQLGNGGDRVQLQRAVAPAPGDPTVQEDEVLYDDLAPWPTAADGTGQSLQRRASDVEGNAATSWVAAIPTPGTYDPTTQRGDFNGDGLVNEVDINLLFVQLRSDDPDPSYDLTDDGLVNEADRDEMIFSILDSTYGDADLNTFFDSNDFVLVFQAGEYEDNIVGNSRWETGDWDGDGEFSSDDFVLAFQTGDYETAGARAASPSLSLQPVAAALEPAPQMVIDEPIAAESPDGRALSTTSAAQQPELIDVAMESLFADERETLPSVSPSVEDLLADTDPTG